MVGELGIGYAMGDFPYLGCDLASLRIYDVDDCLLEFGSRRPLILCLVACIGWVRDIRLSFTQPS
jgi:hypothetical protein